MPRITDQLLSLGIDNEVQMLQRNLADEHGNYCTQRKAATHLAIHADAEMSFKSARVSS